MSHKLNLIAMLGNAGSGKDTVADFILKATKGSGIAFADPLKEFSAIIFQFSKEQLWGSSEKRNEVDHRYPGEWAFADHRFEQFARTWVDDVFPPEGDREAAYLVLQAWYQGLKQLKELTARYVLQTLGTEWGRTLYSDIWVEYGVSRARSLLSGGCPMVVARDCRFINEAKAFKNIGGEVWYVDRPSRAQLTAGVLNHASEREQTSAEMEKYLSVTIGNHGTLADLERTVLRLLEERFGVQSG